MTLGQFIDRFANLRTTAIGAVAILAGALSAIQSLTVGEPINVELVGMLGLIGLIGLNALDGGL